MLNQNKEYKNINEFLNSQLNLHQNLSLDFSTSKLSLQDLSNLSSAFKKTVNLSCLQINLKNNKLGKQGIQALATALENCKNVTFLSLNLMNDDIFGSDLTCLGMALANFQIIEKLQLDLSGNNFGNNLNGLASALQNCISLKYLELKLLYNRIDQSGAIALLPITTLPHLITLNLNLRNNLLQLSNSGNGYCKLMNGVYKIKRLVLNQ
ncbi:hypothetical protein ABPG74_002603 [Tetrahymena malaccensis]